VDNLQLFSLVGLGLVAAILSVTLRQYRPEFATIVSVSAGVLILGGVVVAMLPVVAQIQTIFDSTAVPRAYVHILFRALGICFITQIACDACKDAGESAIGAKVELAGRIGVLVISLPLFTQVLEIVRVLL